MSTTIINLTQHPATTEQVAAGVVDLPLEQRSALASLLTFDTVPTRGEVEDRARAISLLALTWFCETDQHMPEDYGHDGAALAEAMLGGAPYLMATLERALLEHGLEPVYAFSKRESVEQQQPDGSVRKVNVFKHAGFVRMFKEA